MAKKQEDTKEAAVAKVEKQLEQETGREFVETGKTPPTLAETDKPTKLVEVAPNNADMHLYGDVHVVDETGKVSILRMRQGYAVTLPRGSRLATDDEVKAYKGK